MNTFKRGSFYWYKFMFKGKVIRESTKQCNDKVARNMESAHRARLAQQETENNSARQRLGCATVSRCHECEKIFDSGKTFEMDGNVFCSSRCAKVWNKTRTMPTLLSFLEQRFLPDAQIRHKSKPLTFRYYRQGADLLIRSGLGGLRLDDFTPEHAQQFAAKFGHLSPSGINRGLRTLRRALNLAYAWGLLEKPVKIELAKNENQRERVLCQTEQRDYLAACTQPWKDVATVIAEEGMRPSEVFSLSWSDVLLADDGAGIIRIKEGKSKAAKRLLPMTPAVHTLLAARSVKQGHPREGWIFPSRSRSSHLTSDGVKGQHARALKECKIEPFVPYTLRHTALTRIALSTHGDVFALARIAGHCSISITQRYVHTQADTIEAIFTRATRLQETETRLQVRPPNSAVGTNSGTAKN